MTKGLLLFIVFLPGTTAFAAGQDYDWPVFRGTPSFLADRLFFCLIILLYYGLSMRVPGQNHHR